MSRVNVLTEIVINCPREKVAAYAAEPMNAPEWYANIKSADWVRGTKPENGAQAAFRAQFLGRDLVYTYEMREYEPGKLLVMSTADGPFPMETTYTWEDAGAGKTRMTLRNAGTPTGFSRILAPLMTIAMKRANNKDLQLLKKILEK